jgi:GxxExxY protein
VFLSALGVFVAEASTSHKDTKTRRTTNNLIMNFEKLSLEQEAIGRDVVNAAYKVYHELGPGLLEKVYEVCITHELRKKGHAVARQIDIPIQYDGIVFNEGLRLDILVDNLIIVEVKAVDLVNPVWQARF